MLRTAVAIVVFGLAVLPASGQLTIDLEENAVVAKGVTPGGSVVWFGIARERFDWTTRVSLWQDASATADGAGQAVLDLGRDVPVKSLWVVVDVATGAFAALSPTDYPWLTEAPFPSQGALFASDRATLLSLRDEREELEVLVVRPKVGAWRATLRHDDPGSEADTGVTLTASDLIPWGQPRAALARLGPGDLIVAIDPNRLEYFAQQLGSTH
jgi:hypothetical protein